MDTGTAPLRNGHLHARLARAASGFSQRPAALAQDDPQSSRRTLTSRLVRPAMRASGGRGTWRSDLVPRRRPRHPSGDARSSREAALSRRQAGVLVAGECSSAPAGAGLPTSRCPATMERATLRRRVGGSLDLGGFRETTSEPLAAGVGSAQLITSVWRSRRTCASFGSPWDAKGNAKNKPNRSRQASVKAACPA